MAVAVNTAAKEEVRWSDQTNPADFCLDSVQPSRVKLTRN